MPGFVRQDGERHSFFRRRGQAEFVGESKLQSDGGELVGQHRYQGRVFRASSGKNHLLKVALSCGVFDGIALNRLGDRLCR